MLISLNATAMNHAEHHTQYTSDNYDDEVHGFSRILIDIKGGYITFRFRFRTKHGGDYNVTYLYIDGAYRRDRPYNDVAEENIRSFTQLVLHCSSCWPNPERHSDAGKYEDLCLFLQLRVLY